MDTDQTIEIRISKLKLSLLALGSTVFVALGVWLIYYEVNFWRNTHPDD
jgi:uncharacterized membrane protein